MTGTRTLANTVPATTPTSLTQTTSSPSGGSSNSQSTGWQQWNGGVGYNTPSAFNPIAQMPLTGSANYNGTFDANSTNGSVKDTTTNTTSATVALLTGVALAVTPPAQTQDAGLPVLYALAVTNEGNAPDSVSLMHQSTLGLAWKIFVDIDGNGQVDGADSLADLSKLGPLGIGETLRFVALDTIPHATPDGATHWSCRSMAKAQGVSPATVQRIWSARGRNRSIPPSR